MIEQHPSLLTVADTPKKRESPLTLHYKLFRSNHVLDIVGTSEVVPTVVRMTRHDIVALLTNTCVMLDERKAQFELMIHALEKKDDANADEQEGSDEEDVGTKCV